MPVDSQQLDEIFIAALAESDTRARAKLLEHACADDAELRDRLEALLLAHEAAGSFLELPTANSTTPFVVLNERPGSTIGRYKLLEQIGEGGFGVVFMADQERPVRRRVALKIIKLGMDTKQVIARFEAERQALAMMDHPNIAKVFDAGTTDTGRPYFVMELVRGVPITEYCDQARLTTKDRVAVFQTVCSAVQHAHQKGIIHRDLKPSNVLVTLHDDTAVPKVIDFGVAKATQARLTDRTLFTEFRQMIGTPSYMSPEQAQMSGLDVDTRSDVYSLGVLLYELLTGATPIDFKQLKGASYDDLRRVICDVDPPSPSTRLSAMTQEALTTLAERRRCEPGQLAINLRSDLDWIVMRCLEKDRKRRYESASALSLDLQRYLNGEPVEARSPTRRYRIGKFIRRNKVSVIAWAAIVMALVTGLAVASLGLVQARRQAEIAKTENARSEQVAKFLTDMLSAVRPGVARGRDTALLREILDTTSERVEKDLKYQPGVQADLWQTLAGTYQALGDRRKAVVLWKRAVVAYRLDPELQAEKLAFTLGNLGQCQSYLGDRDEGAANARAGLELARNLGDSELIADCLESLAGSMQQAGGYVSKDGEAVPYFKEAVALRRGLSDPVKLGRALASVAIELHRTEDADDAEAMAREALELHRKAPTENNIEVARDMMILGQILDNKGRRQEAILTFRESIDIDRKLYPVGHPNAQSRLNLLADALVNVRQYQEAVDVTRGALEAAEAVYPADSPEVIRALQGLADALQRTPSKDGDLSEVVARRRDIVERLKKRHALRDAELVAAFGDLAESLEQNKAFPEAISIRRGVVESLQPNVATGDRELLAALTRLSVTLSASGNHEEATAIMRDVVRRCEALNPPDESRLLEARIFLSERLFEKGDTGEALKVDRENLARARAASPPSDALVAQYAWILAQKLAKLERFDEALARHREAIEMLRRDSNLAANLGGVEAYVWFAIHYSGDMRDVIAVCDEVLGAEVVVDTSTRLSLMGAKANALRKLEQYDRSTQEFSNVLAISIKEWGAGNFNAVNTVLEIGFNLRRQRRFAEAVEVYTPMIATLEETGKFRDKLSNLRRVAADANAKSGQFEQARKLLDDEVRSLAAENSFDRALLAWSYATSTTKEMRDGASALKLAIEAAELTDYKDASILDTLAAACAETGDFAAAVKWEEQAIQLGTSLQKAKFRNRVADYRQNRRWWVEEESAWMLATSPDPKKRDGKRALELALATAKQTDHKDAGHLAALAAAYAETGDFASAVSWEEKAVGLVGPDRRFEFQKHLESYRNKKRWWVTD